MKGKTCMIQGKVEDGCALHGGTSQAEFFTPGRGCLLRRRIKISRDRRPTVAGPGLSHPASRIHWEYPTRSGE